MTSAEVSDMPIQTGFADRRTPLAQKLLTDVEYFRNMGEWELPVGTQVAEEDDGQATLRLPEDYPTPFRVQPRIISFAASGSRRGSVEGPQRQLD